MRLSIAQKLFAAFVGLTLLVLIATLGLARWSFEQGFLDYVNALEQTRLEQVQSVLAEEYSQAGGSWSELTERHFAKLVHSSASWEPPEGPPHDDGMRRNHPPPARGLGPQPPGVPAPGALGLPPTALYDAAGNLVVGASGDIEGMREIRVPVMRNGVMVGELRSAPRRRMMAPQETEFSRQQLQTSWLIGIASLVLAMGVSLILSRGLLAPVRRMIDSVAQLSNGNYSHRMYEDREDELGQLTKDLDRLGSTLEANQSSRKRLLADISHELRTPLTVLTGEIEALKDGVRKFDEKQLGSLEQEVLRLSHLVEDLYQLSISDVGGLRYQFSSVDIAEHLQHVTDRVRERAMERGIEVSLVRLDNSAMPTELTVTADSQRLEQLLLNLLENSLAYTDIPGKVIVKLSRTPAMAIITVDDTAPGVDEDDCEQLFDPLFRAEASRSRRTGGAGLGLAICKNIASAHGGSITALPSALGGLSVRVEIPLAGGGAT
ncbi:Signal transduction histidine-protein kinase BaeS [Halioglobus japonicus]|nr:Signal transduction histidine-protein kinase BaeS [Halioglobus japonicus]